MNAAKLFRLDGKVAVVTGAVGLLGRQHCLALAEAGANLVIVDLDDTRCREMAESLVALGHPDALGWGTDIVDPASVEQLRDAILGRFGRIDILVNNAGINDMVEKSAREAEASRFEVYSLAAWKRSLDVNVTGTFLCSQILGGEMARHRQGSIINIASTYGVVAPDQSLYRRPDGSQSFFKSAAYPVTKGAVISFTRFLAAYWGPAGVRVNTLSPGGVQNGQEEFFIGGYASRTPLGRMALPHDYKGAVVFLASDASAYMTGANLIVDGGWTAV